MKESELFDYLKEIIPDLKLIGGDCRWDCTSKLLRSRMELKCRTSHWEEMIIEKSKYDALIKASKNPLYINSTPKGIYIWNLSYHNIEWSIEKMPATSEFKNKEKIDKRVGYLKIKDAMILQIF